MKSEPVSSKTKPSDKFAKYFPLVGFLLFSVALGTGSGYMTNKVLGSHTVIATTATNNWADAMKEYRLVKIPDSTQAVQAFQSYQLSNDSPLFGKAAQLSQVTQIDGGYVYVYKVGDSTQALALMIVNQQPTWVAIPISAPAATPTSVGK